MSRRKQQVMKVLMQRGQSYAEAKAEARGAVRPPARPWIMVDRVTGQRVAVLSARLSRARRQARAFGADAQLVRQ